VPESFRGVSSLEVLGSKGRLEPVVVDHVSYRADREVKGNGYDQSHYAGADVFVEERVL
jgi:hypothetical protein